MTPLLVDPVAATLSAADSSHLDASPFGRLGLRVVDFFCGIGGSTGWSRPDTPGCWPPATPLGHRDPLDPIPTDFATPMTERRAYSEELQPSDVTAAPAEVVAEVLA